MLPVVMGIEQWKSLPLDVQFVIEQLDAEARYRFTQGQWYRSREGNYARMKELGCELYQVSDEDVARWEKDTQPIIEDWVTKAESKGLKAKEILAVIRQVAELYK
jgi:TRAP-type C4-dicarboxylate transport system substrate-binding protein